VHPRGTFVVVAVISIMVVVVEGWLLECIFVVIMVQRHVSYEKIKRKIGNERERREGKGPRMFFVKGGFRDSCSYYQKYFREYFSPFLFLVGTSLLSSLCYNLFSQQIHL